MRILYITFDNPAVETILGGMHVETLSGLPAFYHPFRILLERGHTIDLLLFCDQVIMPRFQSVLCSAFGTAEPLIKTVRLLFSASYYINRSISIAPLAAIMRERLDGRLRSPKEERPVTVIILLDII